MSVVFLVIMAIICRWKDIRKLYARIIVPVVAPEVSDAVDAG
jgi:hypothetical protein